MADIIRVLSELSELEWWSHGPVAMDPSVDLFRPPHVVWRHKQPSSALASFLVEAVESFPGTVRWQLTASQRNWLLIPARVMEHTREKNLLGDLPAAIDLERIDPEFGKRANAELPLLAEHIAKAAAKLAA